MNPQFKEWLAAAGTPIDLNEWRGRVLGPLEDVVYEGPAHAFTTVNWPRHHGLDPDDLVVVKRVSTMTEPVVEFERDDSLTEEDWVEFADALDIDLGRDGEVDGEEGLK